MLVLEKTSISFAVELSLSENFLRCVCARAYVSALMTRKSCAVGMRNAILRNHLNTTSVVPFNDNNRSNLFI